MCQTRWCRFRVTVARISFRVSSCDSVPYNSALPGGGVIDIMSALLCVIKERDDVS